MRPHGRSIAALAVFVVVTAIATERASAVPPTPYRSMVPSYVALGDSFSSGVGTRAYRDDGSNCQRSDAAFPVLVAARVGAELTFVACNGADIDDVVGDQLAQLDAGTRYVTVTVGGNDAGFSTVLTDCATPWWAADCGGRIDDAQAFITDVLPDRLDALYDEMRRLAPHANIVIVGYPRLFMGEDCNAGTWFSPGEQRDLNDTADLLDATTEATATSHGFDFVDPRSAFTGHAVCDDEEWVNGLSDPVSESFHPNPVGQRAYADLVDDVVG